MAIAGPPWGEPPAAFELDGQLIALQPMDTQLAVQLVMQDDDDGGLWALIGLADPGDEDDPYSPNYVERLVMIIFENDTTLEQLDDIADDILGAWLGMPRWMARNLWEKTLESWTMIDGDLAARGVDVMDMPPSRACNAVLGVFRQLYANNGKAWEKWIEELTRKPARVMERDAARADDELAAEENWRAMQMLNGGQIPTALQPAPMADSTEGDSVIEMG